MNIEFIVDFGNAAHNSKLGLCQCHEVAQQMDPAKTHGKSLARRW